MDLQQTLNIAIGIILFIGGFMLKAFWGMIRGNDKRLTRIEVMIGKEYVTKETFTETTNRLFEKIDEVKTLILEK